MSRTLSTNVLEELYGSSSAAAFFALVKIEHPSLISPFYITNNGESTVYAGNTYEYWPFEFDPPDESNSSISNARISIDATDPEISNTLLELNTAPSFTVVAVCARYDVSNIEPLAMWPMLLEGISGDVHRITGELRFDLRFRDELGPIEFTPQTCPGVN